MLRFRKETDYALQFLKLLFKKKGAPMSLSEAAAAINVSFLFLQKIARKLRLDGVIKSRQGMTGGYALAAPLDKITLKKIVEIMEGDRFLLPCLGGRCRKKQNCAIKERLARVNKKVLKIFDEIKLKNL